MKHKRIENYNRQRGAAAIFIVVFFALLLGVIVVSFTKIAIQDQQQAAINDLNRGAYDSAEAGLEDATRVLNNYNKKCVKVAPTPSTQTECNKYNTELNSVNGTNPANCNLQKMPGINANITTGEVEVKTNTDNALDQAYTCVKVRTQTPDVKIAGVQDESYLIPLKAVGGNAAFNSVQINWHDAASDGTPSSYPSFPNLPSNNSWGNAPALLRVQAIKVPAGPTANININDINTSASSVFLYPVTTSPSVIDDIFGANGLSGGEKAVAPHRAQCQPSVQYYCTMTMGRFSGSDNYFLRITPLYNNASFQVILNPTGPDTFFDNVQPEIDSTGRANSVFRRIQQRVQYEAPELENFTISGSFEITDGFCKNFNVAVKEEDYTNNCTP